MTSIITGAATGILTVLILILEKSFQRHWQTMSAEKLALTYAKPVYAVTTVLAPVAFLMNQISKGLLIILRIDTKNNLLLQKMNFEQLSMSVTRKVSLKVKNVR